MMQFFRNHPLIWLVPLIVVPFVLAVVTYLAHAESMTPDNPFIYDV